MANVLRQPQISWLTGWAGLVLAAIYLPLLVMAMFSFNDSKRAAVWRGFSWRHYEAALRDHALLEAFGNSLLLACVNAVCATTLGLAAALSMERFRFTGVRLYAPVLALPLVIPEICLGLALLIFFHAINWPLQLPWPLALGTVLIAHITFSLPFAALLIRSQLRQLDHNLELVGNDLGASSWFVLMHVTLPQLRPVLLVSLLLTFTLSLDDFVITFFTSVPAAQLLPVKVFSMVRVGSTPVVNAVSTLLVVLTFIGIGAAALILRRR